MRQIKVLTFLMLLVLVACSPSGRENATGDTLGGVGIIPGNDFSGDNGISAEFISTVDFPEIEGEVLAEKAKGNRLIIIGDSIVAGTASRYGGLMCSKLVPMGWRVVVEAESGQSINFGRTVLKSRIDDGWDAAVVFLGTNTRYRISDFRTDLIAIVKTLAPRPTLLVLTSRFRDIQRQVNDEIRSVAADNKSVTLLDWENLSKMDGILNKDGIHPTNVGRAVLVEAISRAVGVAKDSTGKCLDSQFVDDSRAPGVLATTTTLMTLDTTVPAITTTSTVPAITTTSTVPAITTTSTVPAITTTSTVPASITTISVP